MNSLQRAACYGMTGLLALGCGGDEPAGVSPSILVQTTPAVSAVVRGYDHSEVTASVTRRGGFNGTVTLAISGLPAGVTATITPTQLSGDSRSATITVSAAFNAAAGPATLTITATGPGISPVTATYLLTVTDGW